MSIKVKVMDIRRVMIRGKECRKMSLFMLLRLTCAWGSYGDIHGMALLHEYINMKLRLIIHRLVHYTRG